MMLEINCDILIVGGGVAGLSAALAASKNNSNILLIEKESEIGFKIRGEVIKRESPIFTTIFGTGLPKNVIVNDLYERRIYSPSTLKFIDSSHTEPIVTIDYRLFILELFKEVSKTNCQIFLNTELLDIIRENNTVIGAICRKDRKEIKIFANYLIGANGVHSKFVNLLETGKREIYPILKLNYENLQIPNPHRIEQYLITDPPGAMWMFPKSKSSGECGVVVWTDDFPKQFNILELWKKKSKENKVIREIIKNAKAYYISKDFLDFGGPLKQIFGDGFVVIGDSGGHIGAIGGSGIISSMTIGYKVTKFISHALDIEDKVTKSMIQTFLSNFKKSPIQKFLRKEQKLGKLFRDFLFKTFKTDKDIDENWFKLKNLYSARKI